MTVRRKIILNSSALSQQIQINRNIKTQTQTLNSSSIRDHKINRPKKRKFYFIFTKKKKADWTNRLAD